MSKISSTLLFCFLLLIGKATAQEAVAFSFTDSLSVYAQKEDIRISRAEKLIIDKAKERKNSKVIAVAFAITLGHFGVHRLYLGTSNHVPLFYTATLGGGLGFLPLADIVAIIATKDLSRYENNDKVLMWLK